VAIATEYHLSYCAIVFDAFNKPFKAVVLNHCSEERMRLPSTLCAALSSNKTSIILCNRLRCAIKRNVSFGLCVNVFSAALYQSR